MSLLVQQMSYCCKITCAYNRSEAAKINRNEVAKITAAQLQKINRNEVAKLTAAQLQKNAAQLPKSPLRLGNMVLARLGFGALGSAGAHRG